MGQNLDFIIKNFPVYYFYIKLMYSQNVMYLSDIRRTNEKLSQINKFFFFKKPHEKWVMTMISKNDDKFVTNSDGFTLHVKRSFVWLL